MTNKKITFKVPVHAANVASLEAMATKLDLDLSKLLGLLVNSFAIASASMDGEPMPATTDVTAPAEPKKRGRKPKVLAEGEVPAAPRKRGRPKKVLAEGEVPAVPRKRGRPKKVVSTFVMTDEWIPALEGAEPVPVEEVESVPVAVVAEPVKKTAKKAAAKASKKPVKSVKPAKKAAKKSKKAATAAVPADSEGSTGQ